MADLGQIGYVVTPHTLFFTLPLVRPLFGLNKVICAAQAPISSTPQISGTVVDDNGQPATRTVVAINRRTLAVADVTTSTGGNFTLKTPDTDEYIVICLDDAAGTVYNDLIQRVIPTP